MAWFLDGRIPVQRVADAGALAAALRDGPPAALVAPAELSDPGGAVLAREAPDEAAHRPACPCCRNGGRPPLALALDRLFLARVRGGVPWFERVLVLGTGADALAAVLSGDAVTAARFRPVPPPAAPPPAASDTDNPFAPPNGR